MTAAPAGPEIERLIRLLSKLPGLGPRSARRAALHLIKKKDDLLVPLAKAMDVAVETVVVCSTCKRAQRWVRMDESHRQACKGATDGTCKQSSAPAAVFVSAIVCSMETSASAINSSSSTTRIRVKV